jgi:hypothetical protein
MKRPIALLAGALLTVTFVSCSDDDSTSDTPLVTTATTVDETTAINETTEPPVDEGEVFVDPAGQFSVVFPLEPTESPGSAPIATGEMVDFVSYLAGNNEVAYVVSCIDYAEAGVPDVDIDLEGARDGALTNVGATLSSSADIELQGREGIEFTGTAVAGEVNGRMYTDGNVLCQVVTIGGDAATTTAFLDSFQFLEPAT